MKHLLLTQKARRKNTRNIRTSAKALIIKDGTMAAGKIKDAGEEWYIMPGGGQKTEEVLKKTVCRFIERLD